MPRQSIGKIGPILGTIKSEPLYKPHHEAEHGPAPFITISREPGAGPGWIAASQLLTALNQAAPGETPWTIWDRELMEKIAVDLKLPPGVVESLEGRHSWFADFLGTLKFNDAVATVDELKLNMRVSKAIRALAEKGRVVIVGRGGVFLTYKLPGGIHIRLVAPFEHRVANLMKQEKLTHDHAAARVRKLEHDREAFYRQHWSSETLSPDKFTLTINTAQVNTEATIELITALVRRGAHAVVKK